MSRPDGLVSPSIIALLSVAVCALMFAMAKHWCCL
jgi:hypothetical protein